jgi:hypothetical protein
MCRTEERKEEFIKIMLLFSHALVGCSRAGVKRGRKKEQRNVRVMIVWAHDGRERRKSNGYLDKCISSNDGCAMPLWAVCLIIIIIIIVVVAQITRSASISRKTKVRHVWWLGLSPWDRSDRRKLTLMKSHASYTHLFDVKASITRKGIAHMYECLIVDTREWNHM